MQTDHDPSNTNQTPAPAKTLSIGLLIWCGFGALILFGVYFLVQFR